MALAREALWQDDHTGAHHHAQAAFNAALETNDTLLARRATVSLIRSIVRAESITEPVDPAGRAAWEVLEQDVVPHQILDDETWLRLISECHTAKDGRCAYEAARLAEGRSANLDAWLDSYRTQLERIEWKLFPWEYPTEFVFCLTCSSYPAERHCGRVEQHATWGD